MADATPPLALPAETGHVPLPPAAAAAAPPPPPPPPALSMAQIAMEKLMAWATAAPPPPPAAPPSPPALGMRAWVDDAYERARTAMRIFAALFVVGAGLAWLLSHVLGGGGGTDGLSADEYALLANTPYGGLVTQPIPGGARRVAMLTCPYTHEYSAEAETWLHLVRTRVTNETRSPLPLAVRDYNSRRCLLRGIAAPPPPLLLREPRGPLARMQRVGDALLAANASGVLGLLLDSAPAQDVFIVKAARSPEEALATGQWTGRAPFGILRLFYRVVGVTDDGVLRPLLVEHHDLLALVERYGPSAALRQRYASAGANQAHRTCFCPVYLGLFRTGFFFHFQPDADGWRLIVGLKETDEAVREVDVPLDPLQIETRAMAERRRQLTTAWASRAPARTYVRPEYVYYIMYDLVPALLEPDAFVFRHRDQLTDVKFWSELHKVNTQLQATFGRDDYIRLLAAARADGRGDHGEEEEGEEEGASDKDQSPPPPPPLATAEEAFILPFQRIPRPMRQVAELEASAQDCLAYCEMLEHRVLMGATTTTTTTTTTTPPPSHDEL